MSSYLKIWLPIALVVLPSVIVGLSQSPKTRKIADILKYLLQFLSIVNHTDVEGSRLKMPLRASSKLPPKTAPQEAPPAPKNLGSGGSAGLILLLAASSFLSLRLVGCATAGKVAGDSKSGAINCGVEAIRSDSANLVSTVYAVLTGGAVNWEKQLNALKGLGEDAFACALMVVSQQLLQDSVPMVETGNRDLNTPKAQLVATDGYQKAETYMKKYNLRPQGSK